MLTATQKTRALLAQYHAAKATYESPDPHDREERRYRNMHDARSRVEDVALVEALLAEREWQPIETAPDGTWALVYGTLQGTHHRSVYVARRYPLSGWGDNSGRGISGVTHWMHLPTPPEAP